MTGLNLFRIRFPAADLPYTVISFAPGLQGLILEGLIVA